MAGSRGIGAERHSGASGARTRSGSRRRKIQAELEARNRNSKEVWELQQELLAHGASPPLMDAARQLLQAEHYKAIVEERSLDGLCGYPPCNKPTQALPAHKRWSVNYSSREVVSTEEIRKYCGPECRRESYKFCTSLQPDPAYLRPESAVVRAQEAIAGRQLPQQAGKTGAATLAESDSRESKESQALAEETQERVLPKVRPRTVVRFSRSQQIYTVQCHEYDGGGALPDVTPVKDEAAHESRDPGSTGLLGSSVRERPTDMADAEQEGPPRTDSRDEPDALCSDASLDRVDESSDGDDLYDHSVKPNGKPDLAWVRAWGTLSTWLNEPARTILTGGAIPDGMREERRPGHKGRRDLLVELLTSRLPGELSFLAGQLYELASSLSVHQTLPSVTEHLLYDLLAAILIRQLYDSNTAGGMQPDDYVLGVLDRQTKEAAKALGVTKKELEVLQALVRTAPT